VASSGCRTATRRGRRSEPCAGLGASACDVEVEAQPRAGLGGDPLAPSEPNSARGRRVRVAGNRGKFGGRTALNPRSVGPWGGGGLDRLACLWLPRDAWR